MDASESRPGEEPVEPATILVVDDNDANRALARDTLEDEGHRVLLATGGAAGVQAFIDEAPDCVLLDVRMPEVDGIAACARIRALPRGPDTPILFLTALRDVDTFDRAMTAGGDDFITKPIRPAELVTRVETALRMRRMSAELRGHYELIRQQRDALLRLQLQKERLASFVVHDLKNPVNAMDLHAQLLLRIQDLPETARQSALQIRIEVKHLTRMILNLLDIGKGDEGKLTAHRSEVDTERLISEVLTEAAAAADVRRVGLESSVQVGRTRADEDQFRRVLTNLVENAVRHAPNNTVVRVSAAPVDGGIEVRVADEGTGVPVEMRERIFDPFVQLDRDERHASRGGRGLGLAFCKLAVEAHGGTIWVEEGSPGAIFCVRISHDQ